MSGVELILEAILLIALSGLPSVLKQRKSNAGQWLSALFSIAGSCVGLIGVLSVYQGAPATYVADMSIPGASFSIIADELALFFLVPIFVVSALGSIYGLQYWKQTEHPESGAKLRLAYGLLTAAMALVVISRNGMLLLMAWEVMALAGYFAMTAESHDAEVRKAGWIYLVASHLCLLILFGLVAIYERAAGTMELAPLAEVRISGAMASAIFLLGVLGFGIKAGLFPLHVWLPAAHANAPSQVSALFSGVMIKMGVYGIVRVCWLFPHPPLWWGQLLLVMGAISGILGVVFAIGQHDLKRLLAYHSIENIGIIVMGLGLAVIGRSIGQAIWVALGLGGALLHVWNHALFKTLLFLSAGSVIHAAGTREIDQLGGLGKRMPWTSLAFLIGAVAICGLPPLNGFVSEFLIYLGFFKAVQISAASLVVSIALAAASLALIGGLAVACFVKVYGIVFLGEPRQQQSAAKHECGWLMRLPMGLIGLACFWIGLFPVSVGPILDRAVGGWMHEPGPSLNVLAPFGWINGIGITLLIVTVAGWVFLKGRIQQNASISTWDCGYLLPTPKMQYTSSAFAQMIVHLFDWILLPKIKVIQL